jgi:hypothetical protein
MALASPVVVATAVTTATSTTATSAAKASSVAPGAGGAAAKAGSSALLWKAVGVVVAIGAVASAIVATYSEERAPPVAATAPVVLPLSEPAPTPVVAEPAPPPIEVAPEIRPVTSPKPVVAESRRPTPVAASPSAQAEEPRPQPSKSSDTSRLADEMRHIEAIRAASNAKRHGEALRLLEEYRAAFPTGVLSEEAEAMRIESLARLGRTGAAAALARRFLKERPNSPYTSSVAATLASLPELSPDE